MHSTQCIWLRVVCVRRTVGNVWRKLHVYRDTVHSLVQDPQPGRGGSAGAARAPAAGPMVPGEADTRGTVPRCPTLHCTTPHRAARFCIMVVWGAAWPALALLGLMWCCLA